MRENMARRINVKERTLQRLQLRRCRLTSILIVAVGAMALPASAGPNRYPEKKLTSQEWRDDLDFMVRTLVERHPNAFHSVSREKFMAAAARLKNKLDTLETHQVVVELARLTALV